MDREKDSQVDPYDNADFDSDSDAHSYEGTPPSTSPKELHVFNQNELLQFETIYRKMADSFVDIYKGFTVVEARVIVQPYCLCRSLPLKNRASSAAIRLAFETTEAQSRCADYMPPDPVSTVVKTFQEPDL